MIYDRYSETYIEVRYRSEIYYRARYIYTNINAPARIGYNAQTI